MSTSVFLLCDDEIQAAEADAIAMAYLRETQGANGANWSGVFVDYQGATPRFAILWDGAIAGVFTPEDIEGRIIEGEMLVRENGQFVQGNWEPIT